MISENDYYDDGIIIITTLTIITTIIMCHLNILGDGIRTMAVDSQCCSILYYAHSMRKVLWYVVREVYICHVREMAG
jgi:hypothetical protein